MDILDKAIIKTQVIRLIESKKKRMTTAVLNSNMKPTHDYFFISPHISPLFLFLYLMMLAFTSTVEEE